MSDSEQTPKRRMRGGTMLAVSVVLVLLIGGAFAIGHAVADQGGQTSASSSQIDQPKRADGSGPMMGGSQADRDDWSWMRNHMDDEAWMRHHTGQWEWMQEHPRIWSWMREHRDDMPGVGQGRKFWEHHPTTNDGSGSGPNVGSANRSGGSWCP